VVVDFVKMWVIIQIPPIPPPNTHTHFFLPNLSEHLLGTNSQFTDTYTSEYADNDESRGDIPDAVSKGGKRIVGDRPVAMYTILGGNPHEHKYKVSGQSMIFVQCLGLVHATKERGRVDRSGAKEDLDEEVGEGSDTELAVS